MSEANDEIEANDDEETTAVVKPREGNRTRAEQASIRIIPDPILPPSAAQLEAKRQAEISEIENDPLPADLKSALAVQHSINILPDKTPGKAARLRRIGLHIQKLSRGPEAPWVPFQYNQPIDPAFVNRVRASLAKKK